MAWQVAERNRPDAADGRHHRKATVLELAGAQVLEAHHLGAAAEASRIPEAYRRLQAQLIHRVDGTRARRRVCVVMVAVSVVASFVCVALVVASVVAHVA